MKRIIMFFSFLTVCLCFMIACPTDNLVSAIEGTYEKVDSFGTHTYTAYVGSTVTFGDEDSDYYDYYGGYYDDEYYYDFPNITYSTYASDVYFTPSYWEVSDPKLVEISNSDFPYDLEIKCLKPGTLTVYAYDDDYYYYYDDEGYDGYYDSVTINIISIPSSKITVNSIPNQAYTGKAICPAITLKYGNTALVKNTDYTVSYSNNINIGKATAKITLKGNYSGTITKTFNILPSISKTTLVGYVKGKATLTVKSSDSVKWSSSNTKVAKVNSKGVVTFIGKGKATITATTAGKTLKCMVQVKPISLSATKKTLYIGENTTLSYNGGTGDVTWTSSNRKIVKVSSKGKLVAVSKGKATISAERNGKVLKCVVTVKEQELSSSSLSLTVGTTKTLSLVGAVSEVTWSSSNTKIATVSAKGVVKGKKAGTVKIYATHNGKKYACTVKVKNKPAITIKYVDWETNYLDGVEPKITILSNRKATIKYISFDCAFYNAVGDIVEDDLGGATRAHLRITGPIYAGETKTYGGDAVFYNSNVHAIGIENIVVEYMDGKKEKVSYDLIWHDSYYYYK